MGTKNDNIPYQVRINNFLYELQQKPYQLPTAEDIDSIEEVEFTVNRFYGEAVKPVIELIHMGRVEEAVEIYTNLSQVEELEPMKEKVKKK